MRPTETPNNRFAAGQGYVYDAVGNTIADANGQTYIYDAENKMVMAANASGTLGQYTYDGDAHGARTLLSASPVPPARIVPASTVAA